MIKSFDFPGRGHVTVFEDSLSRSGMVRLMAALVGRVQMHRHSLLEERPPGWNVKLATVVRPWIFQI